MQNLNYLDISEGGTDSDAPLHGNSDSGVYAPSHGNVDNTQQVGCQKHEVVLLKRVRFNALLLYFHVSYG